jgi:predicted CopG family antitoxin
MKTRTISISGESYLSAEVAKDPDGQDEIQRITELGFFFGRLQIDLDRFKNTAGDSVADVILKEYDKLLALLQAQEAAERKQAEDEAAEDEYQRRRLE